MKTEKCRPADKILSASIVGNSLVVHCFFEGRKRVFRWDIPVYAGEDFKATAVKGKLSDEITLTLTARLDLDSIAWICDPKYRERANARAGKTKGKKR